MGKFITCIIVNANGEGIITDTFSYRTDLIIEHVEYDKDETVDNWHFRETNFCINMIKDKLHKGLISYVYITDSYINPSNLLNHFNKYVSDNMMATSFESEILNINCIGFSDDDEEIWSERSIWV